MTESQLYLLDIAESRTRAWIENKRPLPMSTTNLNICPHVITSVVPTENCYQCRLLEAQKYRNEKV